MINNKIIKLLWPSNKNNDDKAMMAKVIRQVTVKFNSSIKNFITTSHG